MVVGFGGEGGCAGDGAGGAGGVDGADAGGAGGGAWIGSGAGAGRDAAGGGVAGWLAGGFEAGCFLKASKKPIACRDPNELKLLIQPENVNASVCMAVVQAKIISHRDTAGTEK
jgi:hypothetical protein